MKNIGWLKISRGIVNHWLWEDANRLKWWLDLLLMAAYESKSVYVNTRLVELQIGQMIASLSFLCQRWNISKPTLLVFLKLLEGEEMIARSSKNNISIITICNYEKYQISENNLFDNLTNGESASYEDVSERGLDNPLDNPCGGGKVDNLKTGVTSSESTGLSGKKGNQVDNLFDNIFDNPLDTRKENILYNTHNNCACAREAELFADMRNNRSWQEQAICMKHGISIEECLRRIDEFEMDCKCQNKTHSGLRDIYQHFSNWLNIQKTKKNEEIRQSTQDKRRGSEVNATSAKDYKTSF